MANGTAVDVEMEERTGPEMIRFKTGDQIEGVLLGKERITVESKPVVRYTVKRLSDAKLFSFLGTADIVTKLRDGDEGHLISVRCDGENTMVKRGDNCMKVFTVMVSKKPFGEIKDSLEITDEDIPF